MQVRKIKTVLAPTKKIPIRAICWSANNRRFAVADSFGIIHLFDENGNKKDSFQTKSLSGAKGGRSYMITDVFFSPDHTKLAVALGENLIIVYRLGLNWDDKKTICNKFVQKQEGILCLCWPFMHPLNLIFGRTDGEVKMAHLQSHKTMRLYRTDSPVQSLTNSPDGHGFISGHFDGSIHRFYFKDQDGEFIDLVGHQKICVHNSIPKCLAWGETIIVSGPDKKVTFYSVDGNVINQLDYTRQKGETEFTSISCNPSGQSFVLSSFNRLRVFNYDSAHSQWEEGEVLYIKNLYNVNAMSWKPDGSRLVLGNTTGVVEFFDTCLKRYRYKNQFEFTFVNPSQVIVKMLNTGTRIVLKSLYGCEIKKLQTKSKYLIGNTDKTLLLGDLETCKLSEVPWNTTGKERYFFDNPSCCLVYNNNDISVIEYGINGIIGSFTADHISPTLISVRIMYPLGENEEGEEEQYQSGASVEEGVKRVAYLTDSHSIRILDLNSSLAIAKISNPESKIDWLELNYRATKLLFRDKGGNLYLYDFATQVKKTLLTFCSYVQWVPNSDVVVAQNRGDLCVWYSIDSPDRVTIVSIKGEVENIIRINNVTAVVVNEGTATVNFALNEGLIQFGTAMELKEYEAAANILDELALSPETEAMWYTLASLVMKDGKFHIAERCYAAIGDISKAKILREIVNDAMVILKESKKDPDVQMDLIDAYDDWRIRAKIEMLNGNFKLAEQIYLEEGKVEMAMNMYEEMQMFEESIELAIKMEVHDAESKRRKFLDWLVKTQQREKAAKIYEKEGEVIKAINQYLQGGFPASAARVAEKHMYEEGGNIFPKILDNIASKLTGAGLFEKAGSFFEKRQMFDRALDNYRKGHCYRNAVELATKKFPDEAVTLEEEWGDWLVSIKQTEGAINHYIEAKKYKKAMDSAISSRQWTKAQHIIESLDDEVVTDYQVRLAEHYASVKDYEKAQLFFTQAHKFEECMKMYREEGMLDEALEIAKLFMTEDQIQELYVEEANKLQERGEFGEAERLYIRGGKPELAIHMYSKYRLFEDMIRLVEKHSRDHLKDALEQIALHLEGEKKFSEAEKYLVRAGSWMKAVRIYKKEEQWENAIRVAKEHGSSNDWKEVAIHWATLVGGEDGKNYEQGAKLLYKYELYEEAINYSLEKEMFNFAFDIARTNAKEILPQVHLEYANYLEDNLRFSEAEQEYINVPSIREAVDMYLHRHEWESAMRVAQNHDPTLMEYVSAERKLFEMKEKEESSEIGIEGGGGGFNFKIGGEKESSLQLSAKKGKKDKNKNKEEDETNQKFFGIESEVIMNCKNGEWKKAEDLVKGLDETSSARIAFAEYRFLDYYKKMEFNKALTVLSKYGFSRREEIVKFYVEMIRLIFWRKTESGDLLLKAHEIYVKLLKFLSSDDDLMGGEEISKIMREELTKWVDVLHLFKLKITHATERRKDKQFGKLYVRTCLSILRHCDILRPDKVFYDAAMALSDFYKKKTDSEDEVDFGLFKNLEKSLFDRLMDIFDATDDFLNGEEESIGEENQEKKNNSNDPKDFVCTTKECDNHKFLGTDIPYEIQVPRHYCVDESKRDVIQEMVLEDVMDEKKKDLSEKEKLMYPCADCENCGNKMYFGNLTCPQCHKIYPSCVITGMPVFQKEKVQCSKCLRPANKGDWNTFINKKDSCPYCGELQFTK